MRGSGWLLILLAALVACPSPARGANVNLEQLRRMLENSNATTENRKKAEKQLRKAEERRKKKTADERKKAQKLSLGALKKAFEKGKKAYDEQRYSVAYLHLSSVAGCGLKQAAKMAAEASKKVHQMDGMARSKLDQAEMLLLKGQATDAATAFLEIVRDFPYGEPAKRARRRLRAVKATPAVAASLRYLQGKAHEDAENYAQALRIYDEVVQRWPEEIAALRAKVAAKKIRQDPDKSEMAREALELDAERECPTLLNLAKNYLINDDRATARAKLNEVVQDYPGTSYAERATAALDALTKEKVKQAMALLDSDPGEEEDSEATE
jgi:TolA-binding protein